MSIATWLPRVLFGICGATTMLLQKAKLILSQDSAGARRFLLQPEQAVHP